MCGIAGIALAGGKPVDRAALEALADALAHRGPDGRGFHVRGAVGLAQTRLAIIDLAGGDQPLYETGERGGVTLVANGEIYNDPEIRRAMPDTHYLTGSDCESPLRLYLRHGLDFTRQLRGMYAIAIDDPENNRVVLARDPFGIKPLYYAETATGLCFASEPTALIKAGLVGTELNDAARLELLQLQFSTGRATIFDGIHRVLPGEMLVVRDGVIAERRGSDPLPTPGTRGLSEADAVRLLDDYLEESIELHQRADVDYGMFLSGGIDSSAILAMMSRLNMRPVKAFTVGFAGDNVHDERDMAQRAAVSVGADHESILFDEEDFWSSLPAVAGALDDPVCDYATLPTYKLARAARDAGLKVILSGEGGDEMFAGYGRYRRAARWKFFGGRPMRSSGTMSGFDVFTDRENDNPENWRRGIADSERRHAGAGRTRLQVCQAVDIDDWLPHDLLTKLDRCLMAHGVEGRVPFIDPVIADFAFRLADRLKVRGRTGKWLLRRWLERNLPAAAPFQRKMGFTVPVGDWISRRSDELADRLCALDSVSSLFDPAAVRRVFAAVAHGGDKRADYAAWTILFYAVWHQVHVGGRDRRGDVLSVLQ
ncbi:MAG: asparagine synthase (glutamine-hydrolyzing) [Rhodospirillales bacterium]